MKTTINNFIGSFIASIVEINDYVPDMLKNGIDECSGDQLNQIGAIVGENRQSRDDTDYRTAIKFKIQMNISNGEAFILIDAIKILLSSNKVHFVPGDIAKCTLHVYDPTNYNIENIAFVEKLGAAGVKINISAAYDTPFIFKNDSGDSPTYGLGFSEKGLTATGGKISERLI